MADEVVNYVRTPPPAPVQAKRNKRHYIPEVRIRDQQFHDRFTPTRVGTMHCDQMQPKREYTVHPHARGDNRNSSPTMRVTDVRFTPTRVGTMQRLSIGTSRTVHPHARGDNCDNALPISS